MYDLERLNSLLESQAAAARELSGSPVLAMAPGLAQLIRLQLSINETTATILTLLDARHHIGK